MTDSYSPADSFNFQVRGDPGAKVSLVAVDNAIFLLSKNRLTQKKVMSQVYSFDMLLKSLDHESPTHPLASL